MHCRAQALLSEEKKPEGKLIFKSAYEVPYLGNFEKFTLIIVISMERNVDLLEEAPYSRWRR